MSESKRIAQIPMEEYEELKIKQALVDSTTAVGLFTRSEATCNNMYYNTSSIKIIQPDEVMKELTLALERAQKEVSELRIEIRTLSQNSENDKNLSDLYLRAHNRSNTELQTLKTKWWYKLFN
jgi:hypothetical protein